MGRLNYLYCLRDHASAPCDVVHQDCPGSASIITTGDGSGIDKRLGRGPGLRAELAYLNRSCPAVSHSYDPTDA